MPKYLIEFTRFDASIIAEYDNQGRLLTAIVKYGSMEQKRVDFLWSTFPVRSSRIEDYKTLPNVKVSEVATDLSFDCFWTTYKNKVGNKKRSERLWSMLSEQDKIKALKHITQYDQHLLQSPGIVKKYPETYLAQTPWEN